tara:strand:+ start:391 stop:696 length:306 start_codon:yes stop_codon:yes gene_type:complete
MTGARDFSYSYLTIPRRETGGYQYIPLQGLNRISLPEFLNHSANPNLRSRNEGKESMEWDEWNEWEAVRDILVGEELTIDYRTALGDDLYYNEEVAPFLKE